jgi:hypothetical protein
MVDVPDGYEAGVARDQRRASFIERFAIAARRRSPRRWCSFKEVADWCARERGGSLRNEERRKAAYRDLVSALLEGKFEKNDRSHVLYLAPEIPSADFREPTRLATDWARELLSFYQHDDFIGLVLDHCWSTHDLCRRWFEVQRIDPPGDWFSADVPSQPTKSSAQPTMPGSGTPGSDASATVHRRLSNASAGAIRQAMRSVYKVQEHPPNVNQVVGLVNDKLASTGLQASKRRIQEIAEEPQFATLRPRPGTKRPKRKTCQTICSGEKA